MFCWFTITKDNSDLPDGSDLPQYQRILGDGVSGLACDGDYKEPELVSATLGRHCPALSSIRAL